MAFYLSRELGGHNQGDIGKAGGTAENLIGKLSLSTVEVAGGSGEKTRPESRKDWGGVG